MMNATQVREGTTNARNAIANGHLKLSREGRSEIVEALNVIIAHRPTCEALAGEFSKLLRAE